MGRASRDGLCHLRTCCGCESVRLDAGFARRLSPTAKSLSEAQATYGGSSLCCAWAACLLLEHPSRRLYSICWPQLTPPDHARTCAYLLDGLGTLGGFRKPGGMDIGIDPILSLIAPLLGDFVGLLLGLYVIFLGQSSSSRPALIRAAFLLGAPLPALARMGGNLVLDSCTGMIPIAGPIIDALFQANLANMQVCRSALRHR